MQVVERRVPLCSARELWDDDIHNVRGCDGIFVGDYGLNGRVCFGGIFAEVLGPVSYVGGQRNGGWHLNLEP